ncbi:hypothetical protein D7B24_002072 [Verticillium nonalfalfae]|uniref:Zn(2)-C6 fungal-type domain-containing protein n=1 Tax=Verticillium nonalfalfae TaxID=1051616 RepID=A0A3M9Y2A3_9PEZI|nr:uncharacterized protein D7B24_002072 [Verticillium nonalfalfae]RNJ53270.1 hypothetical protein D7B24_002072 [Verticillium nonalfalfae]
MLLFTKVAAPKAPKRRSRAGMSCAARLKKKCDETRPQCSRCSERSQDCTYEAVKPRQRKKRDSTPGEGLDLESRYLRRPSLYGDSQHLEYQQGDDTSSKGDSDEAVADDMDALASSLHVNWSAASDVPLISPLDMPFDFPIEEEVEEDVDEEIVRMSPAPPTMAVTRAQRYPDLAMIAPAPLSPPHLEFLMPVFSEFSDCANRRALVDHFANVLSHLIVLRETESGNPFQQLVLPLCYSSTTVQNAIYALSSAHLEHRGSGKHEEKSLYFHNQAIQGLARLIEMGPKADREELLAAIMLLVYFEVLVQRGRSNIVDGHLKGAMTIMSQNDQPPSATSAFLERAFRFYDVIAALSFGKAPISTAPAAASLNSSSNPDPTDPSSQNGVDTLLGLSASLWPILHRLSNLLSLKKELEAALALPESNGPKLAVLRTEFETTADAIESALQNWQPTLPGGLTVDDLMAGDADGFGSTVPESPDQAHLQSILHNALAHRQSAFVHLYRHIHGHPRHHPRVQCHAHASLQHCVATVSHAGPMAALLWPLFVAACEAMTPEDREMARHAFVAIDRRQGMTNIERGWIIVQEVWRRSDFMDAEGDLESRLSQHQTMLSAGMSNGGDLWRRVSEDMGVTIVFG